MKAMILAAGLGKRLGELTKATPKPLILCQGKPLIEHSLEYLRDLGITECVINLHYKSEIIAQHLGDGSKWGIKIEYSHEDRVLNTGGGVKKALGLLGDKPFLLSNCDIIHDIDLCQLIYSAAISMEKQSLAHLVLVPSHNIENNMEDSMENNSSDKLSKHQDEGDFSIKDNWVIEGNDLIFTGVSIIKPQLFAGETRDKFSLADSLDRAVKSGKVSGQVHKGIWHDLGTLEALSQANSPTD